MKFAVYILRASILILLVSLGLYVAYFCMDGWVPDPLEIETIGFVALAALGIGLSLLLTRRAGRIRPFFFWVFFVLYLLVFTMPALVGSYFTIVFMTAG